MSRTISNSDTVIDSRDVIKRIEELEGERTNLAETLADVNDDTSALKDSPEAIDAAEALAKWDEENGDDLKALKALAEEASGTPDWPYGETLIRDSYFETYARELADDIGAVKDDASWPNNHIDWKAASEALQQDYFEVDFAGVTYWVRS